MDMESRRAGRKAISIKETLKNIVPEISAVHLQIIVAVVVGITTLVFLLRWLRKSSNRRGVLIMGLAESGKTLLFTQLCHATGLLTVTSVKENLEAYEVRGKKLMVHDLPGHERIRYTYFDKVKDTARGVLFVLDSASIQKDLRDVAEFLYNVLCDGSVQSGCPKVLIACNKQDLAMAKGSSLVQATLETEINLLRVTKANQLQSVGEGGNNNSFLGWHGKDFQFSHLAPIQVEFVEVTVKDGENLDPIRNWINSLA